MNSLTSFISRLIFYDGLLLPVLASLNVIWSYDLRHVLCVLAVMIWVCGLYHKSFVAVLDCLTGESIDPFNEFPILGKCFCYSHNWNDGKVVFFTKPLN